MSDTYKIRVSARAIIICDNRILLNEFGYGLYYNFVGGAVEQNETAKQAVVREVMEESGLEVEVGELVFTLEYEPASCNNLYGDMHHISVFFRCYVKNGAQPHKPSHHDLNPDDITSQAKWVLLSDICKLNIVPKIAEPLIEYLSCGKFSPSFWAECEHLQ